MIVTDAPMTPEMFRAGCLALGLTEDDVSRETMDRLGAFDALLLEWSAQVNLIARSTIEDRWRRHFLDSAQLFPLIPADARTLVDFGSGAGFPGLVLAALGARRGLQVTLVESTRKKARFLSTAAAEMRLENLAVIPERIESLTLSPPDVITARALARLDKLLAYAHEIAGEKTVCLFLKGQDIEGELTETAKSWHTDIRRRASVTHSGSTILDVVHFRPKRGARVS